MTTAKTASDTEKTEYTQAELMAEARARFGDDPLDFAFVCPSCDDVATIRDFKEAGGPYLAGQGCIGRLLGALSGPPTRGCDWAAFGLIGGPWQIVLPGGKKVWSFRLAPGRTTQ